MEVVLRSGEGSDLPEIVAIYNHYVRASPVTFDVDPLRVEDRRPWWERHSRGGPHRISVAESATGGLLGWASTSPFRDRPAYATTVESSIYCRPEAAGRGVGSRLYAHLFESIQGEDVERIVAGVVVPNPASVALHRRFGFEAVGTFTRVGRKFGRYWDVTWYERPRSPVGPSGDGRPARYQKPK